jgi:hypothetical protein
MPQRIGPLTAMGVGVALCGETSDDRRRPWPGNDRDRLSPALTAQSAAADLFQTRTFTYLRSRRQNFFPGLGAPIADFVRERQAIP